MSVDNLTIRAVVDDFITSLALTVPTGWGDRAFIPPADSLSVRINLLPASKTYLSNIGFGNVDARGLLLFECWGPCGQEMDLDTLAAEIERALLIQGSIGPLWLDNGASAMECRPVDGMMRVQVRANWRLIG